MKDYKIERSDNLFGKAALIEQCNYHYSKKVCFYYWYDYELPVEPADNTVAFFRVKQKVKMNPIKRLFKRLGMI